MWQWRWCKLKIPTPAVVTPAVSLSAGTSAASGSSTCRFEIKSRHRPRSSPKKIWKISQDSPTTSPHRNVLWNIWNIWNELEKFKRIVFSKIRATKMKTNCFTQTKQTQAITLQTDRAKLVSDTGGTPYRSISASDHVIIWTTAGAWFTTARQNTILKGRITVSAPSKTLLRKLVRTTWSNFSKCIESPLSPSAPAAYQVLTAS